MKLIDLYKKWMETGKLPDIGLCWSLPSVYNRTLNEFFEPTDEERESFKEQGIDVAYWASGLKPNHKNEVKSFTPLRQTIVLLICAMCDEL